MSDAPLERMVGAMIVASFIREAMLLGQGDMELMLSESEDFAAKMAPMDLYGVDAEKLGKTGARNAFNAGDIGDLSKFRESLYPYLKEALSAGPREK